MSGVPCLSIRQPWATMIVLGVESVEIRRKNYKHRGPIWIHASSHIDIPLCESMGYDWKELPHGAYIGQSFIRNVWPVDHDMWVQLRDRHLDDSVDMPKWKKVYCWDLYRSMKLRNVVMAKGQVGIFYATMSDQHRLATELKATIDNEYCQRLMIP